MGNIVLCDLDHTLSDARPRDHLLESFPDIDWDEYHSKSSEDKPVTPIIQLINAMHMAGFFVIGLTARPEKWREITIKWLTKHGVMLDEIIMRPDNGFDPAAKLKYEMAIRFFGDEDVLRDKVVLLLDDRSDVTEKFMELGITTLQVKIGGNNHD